MQIVIDISEKLYGLLKYFENGLGLNDKKDDNDDVKTALMRAILNGTPLPKGHGRLIDADNIRVIELEDSLHIIRHEKGDEIDVYIDAPTIIEADKEQEDGRND